MKVVAVIVAFHPKRDELERLCRAILRAGAGAVVVDNSDPSDLASFDLGRSIVIPLGENTGIAHALNVGIARAHAGGADIVVTFDQDSEVGDGFLAALVEPLTPGVPGVTAPVAIDKRTGAEYPSQRLNRFGWPRNVYSKGQHAPVPVDLVITSGAAATTVTFDRVGLMDEDFFIDFVDYEWALRCRRAGVPIWVTPNAVIQHAVGDANLSAGPVRGILHGATRTYYKMRNCFLLFRKRGIPRTFAALQLASGLVHNLIQVAIVEQHRLYLRTYVSAIRDGLVGVRGRRPAA